MSASLKGLIVWVTRPAPEALASAQRWEEAGATVTVVPFLEVVHVELSNDQIQAVCEAHPDRIVFTSGRAVEHLLIALGGFPTVLDALRSLPAWCMGSTTTSAARAAGFAKATDGSWESVADLAAVVVDAMEAGSELLFPASAQRRGELPRIVKKAGVQLTEWTVYDVVALGITEPAHRNELHQLRPLLLLYSPSAVLAGARILSRMGGSGIQVAAIGGTTAAAAQEWDLELIATAEKANDAALIAAVAEWWEQRSA